MTATNPILDAWYAAIKSGDQAAFGSITTPDVELFWNGDPALIPWAGSHKGQAAVLEFFALLGRLVEVLEVNISEAIACDGGRVILGSGRWRIKATKLEIRARMANVFRFSGSRVSRYEVYNDTAAFAAALHPEGR